MGLPTCQSGFDGAVNTAKAGLFCKDSFKLKVLSVKLAIAACQPSVLVIIP